MRFKLGLLLAFIASSALAITQAEHDAIVKDVDVVVQKYVTTAPIAWPRIAPDVLDIDLAGYSSVLDAKWLDGNTGWDGQGRAIHYGSLAGPLPIANGVADYSGKFSNPSCPPQFLTESSLNLHFLRSCTDGTGEVYNGSTCPTCRLTFWIFDQLTPRPEYYVRFMVRIGQATYDNDTELGIKFPGLAGDELEIGPTALSDPTHEAGKPGWELQTYRFGFESGAGFGIVEKMGLRLLPGRWYTIEQHDRANTVTNGVYNKDGLIEVKVDGKLVWVRNNVQQYGPPSVPTVRSLLVQFYHGGLKPPKGRLEIDFARLAICKSAWCGPPVEVLQ